MTNPLDRYEIKNYKTFGSYPYDEGPAYDASLYRDGKPIGKVHYEGHGGPVLFDRVPGDATDDLRTIGALLYEAWCAENGAEHDRSAWGDAGCEDIAVEELIKAVEAKRERQKLMRKAKKQVLFVLDDEDPLVAYRFFPAKADRQRALIHLKTNEKYAKHTVRVMNGDTGEWEALS